MKTLRNLIRQLKKAKVFPYGFSRPFAKSKNFNHNSVQEALRGRYAPIQVLEALVVYAEEKTSTPKTKPPKLDVSNYMTKDLIEEKVLPNHYGRIVGKKMDLAGSTVYSFVEKQLKGAAYYRKGRRILLQLRALAAYNKEMELVHRARKVLEAISKHVE